MTQDLRDVPQIRGVGRLPTKWEISVQLIGTFGLAVFLVLYYVLFMQPREVRRYEELRRSVDSVVQLVQTGRTLVTREQADRLKELFILSASPELTGYMEATLSQEAGEETVSAAEAQLLTARLSDNLQEILVVRTRLLRGLSRGRDDDLSELLKAKLIQSGVATRIAERAVREWPYRSRAELERMCRESLYASLRSLADTGGR